MRFRTHVLATAIVVVASLYARDGLIAQPSRIRVAVELGSGDAGQLFGSILKGALRSLADIDVVSVEPDYVIDGVVMCDPKERCISANSYVGALRLSAPLSETDVLFALYLARASLPDSVVQKMHARLKHFEWTHNTWVINYGRDVYERALRELIAKIDATCFEKVRLQREIAKLPSKEQDVAYKERIIDKEWGC